MEWEDISEGCHYKLGAVHKQCAADQYRNRCQGSDYSALRQHAKYGGDKLSHLPIVAGQ